MVVFAARAIAALYEIGGVLDHTDLLRESLLVMEKEHHAGTLQHDLRRRILHVS
jgi:hypothetical protein